MNDDSNLLLAERLKQRAVFGMANVVYCQC